METCYKTILYLIVYCGTNYMFIFFGVKSQFYDPNNLDFCFLLMWFEEPRQNIKFENKSWGILTQLFIEDRFEKKSTEDMKSEEQLSQSPISGKPSPFIGSMRDLNIIRPFKKETLIRNKSWDNFCFSTIFLENRYRKALKHSKVLVSEGFNNWV